MRKILLKQILKINFKVKKDELFNLIRALVLLMLDIIIGVFVILGERLIVLLLSCLFLVFVWLTQYIRNMCL